jgi:hypothetical protein
VHGKLVSDQDGQQGPADADTGCQALVGAAAPESQRKQPDQQKIEEEDSQRVDALVGIKVPPEVGPAALSRRKMRRSGNCLQCRQLRQRRTFLAIAERNGAKAGNLLLGGDKGRMALRHSAAGVDQSLKRNEDLFQRVVPGGDPDAGDGTGADHLVLKIGDLDQGSLDAVLHGSHLLRHVHCGLLDQLPAHELSLPKAAAFGLIVASAMPEPGTA